MSYACCLEVAGNGQGPAADDVVRHLALAGKPGNRCPESSPLVFPSVSGVTWQLEGGASISCRRPRGHHPGGAHPGGAQICTLSPSWRLASSKTNQLIPAEGASLSMLGSRPCRDKQQSKLIAEANRQCRLWGHVWGFSRRWPLHRLPTVREPAETCQHSADCRW